MSGLDFEALTVNADVMVKGSGKGDGFEDHHRVFLENLRNDSHIGLVLDDGCSGQICREYDKHLCDGDLGRVVIKTVASEGRVLTVSKRMHDKDGWKKTRLSLRGAAHREDLEVVRSAASAPSFTIVADERGFHSASVKCTLHKYHGIEVLTAAEAVGRYCNTSLGEVP